MTKRFFTDYPLPDKEYDGRWRRVHPVSYDGDKYVTMADDEEFKLGYIHHGRPMGPRVTTKYANRFWGAKQCWCCEGAGKAFNAIDAEWATCLHCGGTGKERK